MKKAILLVFTFLLFLASTFAQVGGSVRVWKGGSAPSGSCAAGTADVSYNGAIYTCSSGTWAAGSGGGGGSGDVLARANGYDAKGYSAVGDGSTDDRGALNTLANTTISGEGKIVFPTGDYSIQSNITFPANVQLEFMPGARLKPSNSVTITILGNVLAEPGQQIFTNANASQGTISFASNNKQLTFWVEWWGAKGDNSTNSGAAINAAFAATENGRTVRFASNGKYRCELGIVLDHKFQVTVMGNDSLIGYADPNTKPTLIYMGADGGTALTLSNVYGVTVKGIAIWCANGTNNSTGADIGIRLTFTSGGSPSLTSRCSIENNSIYAYSTRSGWVGISIDNTNGANNEHHIIAENLIYGYGNNTYATTIQTGILQAHSQVKSVTYRRNNISNVGKGISFQGNFHSTGNTYVSVNVLYEPLYALENTYISGDDVEQGMYILKPGGASPANAQHGVISFIGCRYGSMAAPGTSSATAPVQTVGGDVTFKDCFFQTFESVIGNTFGKYFVGGPGGGVYPPVTFDGCEWYGTEITQMAEGFQSCSTLIRNGRQEYRYGATQYGIGDSILSATPGDNNYAVRRLVAQPGATAIGSNASVTDPVMIGDGSIGIGGLHMPGKFTIATAGTPGSTSRRFTLVAKDSAGRTTHAYADSGNQFVAISTSAATLNGTNYLVFTIQNQFPAPASWDLYDVDTGNADNLKLLANITPGAGATTTYNLQTTPPGTYDVSRAGVFASNNAGVVNIRSQMIFPIETTFTANDTTPSVAVGNDFKTANSSSTSITTFDDATAGKVIRVYVNDANTTFVNGGTLITGTGANLGAISGAVYSFVYRNSAWRLISSGAASGSGITSLGGLTGGTQTFANDTNVTISSSGTTHTLGWTGALSAARGGTSFASYTAGDLLYASGTTALSKLNIGSNGQCLVITSGLPAWGSCSGSSGYGTVQEEGSNLTARATLNFVGSSFTAADDSGNSRTNVTADSDLDALASNSTNGLWARTGSGTGAARTVTGTSNQITVTNGDGVSGNPTLSTPQDIATASNVRFGNLGLGVASPSSGGQVSSTLGANNITGLLIKRNTDTSPTGKFFDFQNAAGTAVASMGIDGSLTVASCTGCAAGANPSASVGLSAVNGSATTFMRSDGAPALSQSIAPSWTGLHTFLQTGLGTSPTDPVVISNTTAATVGAQQYSPGIRFTGQGWKTNATAASQAVDWMIYNRPVQGAANPTTELTFQSQVNAGGYTERMKIDSAGNLTVTSCTGCGAGISGLTANRIPYASNSTTLTDTANLTWNNTNQEVFIGDSGGSADRVSIRASNGSGKPQIYLFDQGVSGYTISTGKLSDTTTNAVTFDTSAAITGSIEASANLTGQVVQAKDASTPSLKVWKTSVHTFTFDGSTSNQLDLKNTSNATILSFGDSTKTSTFTSANSAAMAVGANGATDPVFQIDTATASVATGVKITGAAAGSGVNLSVISSGTNEGATITPKGTGNLQLASGLLQFHGATSSFPALKRSTTTLQVRLADDSAYGNFAVQDLTINGTCTGCGSGSSGANPSASVGLTAVNGAASTFMRSDAAPALSQSIAPSWTGLHTFLQTGLGTSPTDPIVLSNTTAAAAGAQQYSPGIRFTGQGWKTNATAASQAVDWMVYNRPVQGAANPSTELSFQSQVNAGGYTEQFRLVSDGSAVVTGNFSVGAGKLTVTSANSAAMAVGANGATNPQLQVDAATASVATGLKVTGAAAGSAVNLAVISSGTNESFTITPKGTGNLQLVSGLLQFHGTSSSFPAIKRNGTGFDFRLADDSGYAGLVANTTYVISTAANALQVGDVTNPSLKVDASTGSAVTGLQVTGKASGNGVLLSVISSGSNENLDFQVKGTGVYRLLSTASGPTDLRLFEDTDNGSNYVSLIAPASMSGDRVATLFDATDTIVGKATTDTFTNKTYNVEDTGNSFSSTQKIWIPAAGCNNTTAGTIWDLPTSSAASATCRTPSASTQRGVLDFASAATAIALNTIKLPSDWVSGNGVDAEIVWQSTSTSGNVVWEISLACAGDGDADDVTTSYQSFSADAAKGTANQLNSATKTNITTTGTCAAGDLMTIALKRQGGVGSDTMTTNPARLVGLELTYRSTK